MSVSTKSYRKNRHIKFLEGRSKQSKKDNVIQQTVPSLNSFKDLQGSSRIDDKPPQWTLRKLLLTKAMEQALRISAKFCNYHSMYPLEPTFGLPHQEPTLFSFVTSCYRAISYKDGLPCCLRRIHGFYPVKKDEMILLDQWKKLQHVNIVPLREFFISFEFGDLSLIFVHDYIPGVETMMKKHFLHPNNNVTSKWNKEIGRQYTGLLHENLIWIYVIQLISALKCIHSAGLACRVLNLTKILITDKTRLQINGVGVIDVLGNRRFNPKPSAALLKYQQEDMLALGKIVLALACNSAQPFQQENMQMLITFVDMNYSSDLKNLIKYLTIPQQQPLSVNILIPMIGTRFCTQLSSSMMRVHKYTEEAEAQRLEFKILLHKLETIIGQTGYGEETGLYQRREKFLMKLFMDHVFHRFTNSGASWVDLLHIPQCLNKLEAGVPEKICLMSRDKQNAIVVSYAELKEVLTKSFDDIMDYQYYND